MARPAAPTLDRSDGAWSPGDLSIERLLDDRGVARVSMLRHPGCPYVGKAAVGPGLETALQAIALDYLEQIAALAGIEAPVEHLRSGAATGFGWFPVRWGRSLPSRAADAHGSFWVERETHAGAELADRSAVLLAGNRLGARNGLAAQPGVLFGAGLRVVAHVGLPDARGACRVRFTGASFADVHLAWPKAPDPAAAQRARDHLDRLLGEVVNAYGFDPASLRLESARWNEDLSISLAGAAVRDGDAARQAWAWGARGHVDAGREWIEHEFLVEQSMRGSDEDIAVVEADPLLAPAPAGFRELWPTPELPELEALLRPLPDAGPRPAAAWAGRRSAGAPAPAQLVLLQVMQDASGDAVLDPAALLSAPDATLGPESDAVAAWFAYRRGVQFFDRLNAYGLSPRSLFRLADLPLRVRHRARLRGEGDGKAVNAQVRAVAADTHVPPRYLLEVQFGAAALSHRDIQADADGRPRSQTLGLAVDEHWAWHEFGHVLAFASTGRLEFPFAHSAGDALAAVVADPQRPLDRASFASGQTFPQVRLNRRHDRDAALGWCWCGRRNARRLEPPTHEPFTFTGYFAEQLLSSSIFRLYRALGGDTDDREIRLAASDYVVYLVMRATALLGPYHVVPARSADQFVSALIDADVGTGAWDITARWPGGRERPLRRQGGAVHKVVRWAFEQQGLFATDQAHDTVEGTGRPPPVDVYIPGIGARADGGYTPVALPTLDEQAPASVQPWHASAQGIALDGRRLRVVVGNRGLAAASGVRVEAWIRAAGSADGWHALTPVSSREVTVAPGAQNRRAFEFDLDAGLEAGPCVVLARAGCEADRATTDPAAALACAWLQGPERDPRLLTDQVANDNNLGLRLLNL